MRKPATGTRDYVDDGRTITIRLTPDGRVLFHDLTADLLPVARRLCPTDDALKRRQHAANILSEIDP